MSRDVLTCAFRRLRGSPRPNARRSLLARMLWFAGCAVALVGCDGAKQDPAAAASRTVRGPDHRFAIDVGGQPTRLRLAIETAERQRGLMNVPSMPEDEGMLFIWERPQRMSFYMRNCTFPQDIGFFDAAGILQEVRPMYPGVEDSVVSARDTIQFALEMNQGWYLKHSVRPGAALNLEQVRAALRERGYRPERFIAADAEAAAKR